MTRKTLKAYSRTVDPHSLQFVFFLFWAGYISGNLCIHAKLKDYAGNIFTFGHFHQLYFLRNVYFKLISGIFFE